MKYDFETLVKRKGVGSGKWEGMYKANPEVGEDVVPFSVADMELKNARQWVESELGSHDRHDALEFEDFEN